MCNKLHPDARPVKNRGWAWKMFEMDAKGNLHPINVDCVIFEEDRWYKWNPNCRSSDGFCAFPTLVEAKKATKPWSRIFPRSNFEIRRIRVRGVLGENDEDLFVPGFTLCTLIVKEFFIPSNASTYLAQAGRIRRVYMPMPETRDHESAV